MSLLKLISHFDPFLSAHISKYGNGSQRRASYLLKTTGEEVNEFMGEKLRQAIMSEIKSKAVDYYSVSVDSTPDKSHIDQLTVIVRYVSPNNRKVVERFLTFLPIECHTSEYLAGTLVKNQNACWISNCSETSYMIMLQIWQGNIMACNNVYWNVTSLPHLCCVPAT